MDCTASITPGQGLDPCEASIAVFNGANGLGMYADAIGIC